MFSETIEQDVFDVLTLEGSVGARNHIGGTAPEQVRKAVKNARQLLISAKALIDRLGTLLSRFFVLTIC